MSFLTVGCTTSTITNLTPRQLPRSSTGRWETLIPIPVGTQVVNYHFKFDYNYNAIMMRNADSKLSPPYQLKIEDNEGSVNLLMERED